MDLSNMLGLFKSLNNNTGAPNNTMNMLMNMLSKNGAPNNNQNTQQPQQENVAIKSNSDYYPYGELPIKYTKSGQEALKQQYMKKASGLAPQALPTQNTISNFNNSYNYQNYNMPDQNKNTYQAPNNNFNNTPAESNNVNTQNNSQENMDLSSMLPMLGNLLGNNGDAVKQLVPMLNKGGNLDTNDLLKLFAPKATKSTTKTENTLPESKLKDISSFKKAE